LSRAFTADPFFARVPGASPFLRPEKELADRFDAGEELESLGFDVKKAQVELPKQCLIGHYLT